MKRVAITNKHANFRLLYAGAFGNKLRTWRSPEEYFASDYSKPVVIRYLGAIGGQWCVYNVNRDELPGHIERIVSEGGEVSRIMINEGTPAHRCILNGELWNGPEEQLLYSTVRTHMRPALAAEQLHCKGLQTRHLLRSKMTPSSYEDLQVIMEMYPDHAIELTVFDANVGDTPGRNSIVWEVRRY